MANTSTPVPPDWETRSYNGIILGFLVRQSLARTTYRARYYSPRTLFSGQNETPTRFFDRYPKPRPLNRETVRQQTWRGINRAVHRRWLRLSEQERAGWDRKARQLGVHRVGGYGWNLHHRRWLQKYKRRHPLAVGSSKVGEDYVLYGRLWTVGLSKVASGDKLGGLRGQSR